MKTVPDMDKVPDADWASGAASSRCDFSYTPMILDPYCESGAELVLRMMDKAPADAVSADALTIGEKISEKPMRTLAALGYRDLYRIDASENASADAAQHPFDPAHTAGLIAGFCKGRRYDVIVLGMESYDEGSRLTPYYVAEMLGLPVISDVTSLELADGEHVRITHRGRGSVITETVHTPLLITTGDIPSCLLRVPTLKQRSAASRNAVKLLHADEIEGTAAIRGPVAQVSSPKLVSLSLVDQTRQAAVFDGTAEEAAAEIYKIGQEKGVLK